MDKLYLNVLEKSEGKLVRDKSQYQRLPFIVQKKGKTKTGGGIDCPIYLSSCG